MTNVEASFADQVHMVLRQMGGEASIEQLDAHLMAITSRENYLKITKVGWRTAIRRACTRRNNDTGLPEAPSVNGVYKQLEFYSVDEYRVLIGDHMHLSRRERAQAQRFADECESAHGVRIDVEDYATETG